jgi:hypothetical protein
MQQRIKCPRTDMVAVFLQFLDQPEPIYRSLRCVVQDVELDESGKQIEARTLIAFPVFGGFQS